MKKNIYKKKKFAVSRLAAIMATRWTGNKLFFKGGLTSGLLWCDGRMQKWHLCLIFFFLVETEKNVCDRRLIVMSLSLLMYIAVVVV